MDKHLNRMSDEEKSKKLGHSIKVNKDHYSPISFDQKVSSLSDENNSLKRENLLLKERLKALETTTA